MALRASRYVTLRGGLFGVVDPALVQRKVSLAVEDENVRRGDRARMPARLSDCRRKGKGTGSSVLFLAGFFSSSKLSPRSL